MENRGISAKGEVENIEDIKSLFIKNIQDCNTLRVAEAVRTGKESGYLTDEFMSSPEVKAAALVSLKKACGRNIMGDPDRVVQLFDISKKDADQVYRESTFDLLDAGEIFYAERLGSKLGKEFITSSEFIEAAKKCLLKNIINGRSYTGYNVYDDKDYWGKYGITEVEVVDAAKQGVTNLLKNRKFKEAEIYKSEYKI